MARWIVALAALLFAAAASAALNLNTATKDELVALPGIGPSKAQAIVDYRNQNGPFRSVDELRKVKGIGEKLFNQLRPELTVGPKAATGATVATAGAKPDAKPDTKAATKPIAGTIAPKDERPRK